MKLKSNIMKASEKKQRNEDIKKKICASAYQEMIMGMKSEQDHELEYNSKCPHCGGTKINDRIRDVDGMSGGFFGGGFIHTEPVNKCNDCGHEWKKYTRHFESDTDIIKWQVWGVISELNINVPITNELYRNIPISLFKNMVKEYLSPHSWSIPSGVLRRRRLLKAGFIK